jgi:type II secretory pathway pseudopilin PulG
VIVVRRMPPVPRRSQQGFTYLMVLVCVVVIGLSLAGAATVWTTAARRDREQELLWVGSQFRLAVKRYYEAGPGGVKMYPRSLDDLLEDRRWPEPRRHLRRMYADPITGLVDWQPVLTPDGQILGVNSPATGEPLKHAGFDDAYRSFAEAKSYADWRFVYLPQIQN